MSPITLIGFTDWRNSHQAFGIKDADRFGHVYAIGKTGTGKSTLLLNMAISDIERGNGICVIDPHGDLVEQLLNYIPASRIEDVVYFNACDEHYAISFNPLDRVDPKSHHILASGLISTFKKLWADSWGPRLEHILRYSILTLLQYPSATLLDIHTLLTDQLFRNMVLTFVSDSSILSFWKQEFDKYSPALKSEAIAPILNKMGLLSASLPLRYIVGQQTSALRMEEVMDQKKILICNLSKGQIGEDASALLGSMLLTAIQSAALFRASYDLSKRVPFYLFVDEMHSFVTLSFVDILAESRKYGLSLFLTHQYIEQLNGKIQAAIFGNVGTIISFRVGAEDAERLAKEFYPVFKADDFVNLPRYSMYLKLMIDGATSKPFSATTIPLKQHETSHKETIIKLSREKNCRPMKEVKRTLEQCAGKQVKHEQERTLFSNN